MNGIQSLIDRQLGIYCRLNYDNILKRLVVDDEESFYGLQSAGVVASYDQDPPIFACRFAEAAGYEHILAIANEDGRVAIQNTLTTKSSQRLDGFQCHNNAVFDLAWMPGHMNFVTVSGDHTACLWDVSDGTPKRVLVFSHHTRSVKTAVFPPNKPSVFATGARDGHILIWDIRASGQPSVALKPDNCLINCHSSFTPKTPGSHGKRPRIDHRAISITGLVFRDELTLFSSGECDGNIKAWDLRKNYSAHKREPLPKHSIPYCGSSTKNGYTNLIVDDARVRLYASCTDDVIYCFNVSAPRATPERRYVGHENSTFYIKTCLSPDCEYLVSGSSDKSAYVWSVRRSEPIVRLVGHRAEVTCAAWSRRGDARLVTCSDDARHKIWRIGREDLDAGRAREGRAEPAPPRERPARAGAAWAAGLKRRAAPIGPAGAKRPRAQPAPGRNTKRCLADFMHADEPEATAKRPKLDLAPIDAERLLPAGIKRRLEASPPPPAAGAAGAAGAREPAAGRESESPPKLAVISFRTPTKDLPNFVMSGEAPHLRLMSPAKKKRDRPNWLAQLGRDRRWRGAGEAGGAGEAREADAGAEEARRAPRAAGAGRSGTLLRYFSVTARK